MDNIHSERELYFAEQLRKMGFHELAAEHVAIDFEKCLWCERTADEVDGQGCMCFECRAAEAAQYPVTAGE